MGVGYATSPSAGCASTLLRSWQLCRDVPAAHGDQEGTMPDEPVACAENEVIPFHEVRAGAVGSSSDIVQQSIPITALTAKRASGEPRLG